jgi:beta-lactamase regulating signal transducer with metallopeptidase domain/HEAT repeat protein
MTSTLVSSFGDFSASSISMLLLLAKATIILLLALGITVVMQRASAGSRHLVWLVTVAALLFVPALTAWAPLPVRVLPSIGMGAREHSSLGASRSDKSPAATAAVVDKIASDFTPVSDADALALTNTAASDVSESRLIDGISVIFLLWAAVVIAIVTSLAYAALAVRRIVNRSRPLDTPDWLNPLWEVSDRLALEEPPRLLRSEDAKMPFACGLVTPTIVLPAECDGWTLDRRRAVLLHELAHVRRHDLVGHTLGRLACAVYWFHPLVWTAAKQLRSESERACDDLALACGARATDYAEHLLDIVTSVRRDATPSVALAMARRKEFEGRMLAILDPELRHSSPSRKQSATLIGSLALISIVVGAAAPAPRNEIAQIPPTPAIEASAQSQASAPEHMRTSVSEHTSTGIEEHTSTDVQEHTSTIVAENAAAAVNAIVGPIVNQTVSSVMASPQALMKALVQGRQKGIEKDSDERPALLARVLATDTSASLRRIAAWGLAEYADRQIASDALANALRRDSDPSVREMAAWALSESDHSTSAVDALAAALHSDANTRVRVTAAWALGNVGDRSAADALAPALSDASPEVRKRAAWALGNTELRQAPPALIALLNDKDPEMRHIAAWALYQIEDPASISGLEAALAREPNKDLQVDYIRALAAVGEKSVDALKGLIDSKDPEVRSIAVRALAGGHATGPWPWPWPEPRPFPH